MKKRISRPLVLTLIVVCLFSGTVPAQRRRALGRTPAPRTHLAPITAEQRAAVADILKKAGELEITYNYSRKRYAEDAYNLATLCSEAHDMLRAGTMQYLLLDMWSALRAASIMYGVCLPSHQSSWHGYLGLDKDIPRIVRQYKLQNMTPCQAQRELFNYARILTFRLQVLLNASPPTRVAPFSGRTNSNKPASGYQADAVEDNRQEGFSRLRLPARSGYQADAVEGNRSAARRTPDRVERNEQPLSDQIDKMAEDANATPDGAATQSVAGAEGEWTFPRQGMQHYYSATIKGNIYYVGDGLYAGHTNLAGQPIVLVAFSKPIPENEVKAFDLSFLIVSRVIKLPSLMTDALLPQENDYEHRFRTASGKVVAVTLAYDRKTAVVRLK